MEFYWIVLSLALVVCVGADSSCPDAAKIAPCTCDGEGLNCMGPRTIEEVKNAFKADFPYKAVRSVWIQGTPITTIPGDLFGNVKSQQFYIEVNNITSVDFNAFSASKKTLKNLSLFGNSLVSLDYLQFTQFENLAVLNLGRNQITSIPNNAFDSKSLYQLILAQNKISHIGMNAFSNLPNLGVLQLALNSLTTLGPMSFAFRSHSPSLQINLAGNSISSVSSLAFQGAEPYVLILSQNRLTSLPQDVFANLITRIGQKGGFIEVSSNPFSCNGCDYSWIVLNKLVLRDRFIGFTCTDGRSILDLTRPGINC